MPSTKEAPLASGIAVQRAALDAVLRSRSFAKNPRLSALVEYLCERCFGGQGDSIKEFNIATDVFGRPADFDQSQDAIVRVEMHRLRKKLAEFYATEGQQEPVEIVIHSGHYLPEFVLRRTQSASAEKSFPAEIDAHPPFKPPSPAVQPPSRNPIWLIAGLLVVAIAALLIFFWPRRALDKRPIPAHETATELQVAAAPTGEGVHILCGSSTSGFRDREGNVWDSDAFFSGGSAVAPPDEPLYRSRDSFLFRSMRTGEFSYKIPLKPGIYELHLYFADQSYSPGIAREGGEGTRIFTVMLNGGALLREFDIIADAGPNTADVRVFKDVHPASDGYLHLSFSKVQGTPLINAIEIVPGIPHRLRPIRIVTQDGAITDRTGVTWYPDNYFLSGRTLTRSATVTGTEDPEIYDRERYGNFSYAIPVSDGRYRVTLRFAETYWGPNAPGGEGPDARVFDVYCNGLALLRNFDMLKEAAPRSEIVKTFRNIQPNAQGKLLLSFVPVKNYANISAIEVVDDPDTP